MKKFLATIGLAFAALQAPAHAAVIVTSLGNTPQGAVSGSTYITFEDVALGTVGAFPTTGYAFSGDGKVVTGDGLFQYLQPKSDTTHFLSIGFNAGIIFPNLKTETLSLGSDYTKFGFYWGSIDQYNTVTFLNDGVTMFSLSGNAVPSVNLNAAAATANTRNRYVNFDFTNGMAFDEVVFGSTRRGFEVDNLAFAGAVPELSTWAMMLVGFAGMGTLAWRRNRKRLSITTA